MKVSEFVNLPSSELVLAILNEKDVATESVINHYKGYVGTASMLTISENGTYDIIYSEDLEQEIRIRLMRSIKCLRLRLINELL